MNHGTMTGRDYLCNKFYCNKFLKYKYKELVPIENLGQRIGPRGRNGPLSECPLSTSAILKYAENTELGKILLSDKGSVTRQK